MKFYALLLVICLYTGSFTNAQSLYADTHDILYTGHEYFVTFASESDGVGHAFIILEHNDYYTNRREVKSVGFYPNNGEPSLIGTKKVLYSKVDGTLLDEMTTGAFKNAEKKVKFRIDKAQFEKIENKVEELRQGKSKYDLFDNDCVTFIINIGKAAGILMPDRGILNTTPSLYLTSLLAKVTSPSYLQINNKYVSASANGSYMYSNNPNPYQPNFTGRKKVQWPNAELTFFEADYLYGEINGPTVSYFPNGDSWLQDKTVTPQLSIYSYANGNIFSPYMSDFDYQIGRLEFKNGGYYYGGVKYGIPEGQGTYFTKEGISHTGVYKNGQLQYYTFINMQNGVYYGPLKNSLPIGNGKYTFYNDDIYDGSFQNGSYNGKGKYTFKSGYVYEGNFQNGSLAFGKISFPNGDSYTGEILNWKMTGKGTYLSKNNGQIASNNNNENVVRKDNTDRIQKDYREFKEKPIKAELSLGGGDDYKAVQIKDGKATLIEKGVASEIKSTKKVN